MYLEFMFHLLQTSEKLVRSRVVVPGVHQQLTQTLDGERNSGKDFETCFRAEENERFRPAGGVWRRQLLVGHLPDKLTDRWNMSDCRLINVTDDNDFTKIIINHSFPVLSQINVCYANRLKKKL